jgi:hypothetical protein
MNGSKCDFHVQTGAGPILHLTGTCTATTFEGKYRQADRNDAGSRGSFRLASKPAEEADDTQSAAARKAAAPASVTQCIEPTPAACSAARRPTRTRPSCAPASAAAASRAARAAPRCAEPARARPRIRFARAAAAGIIRRFSLFLRALTMEAERLNAISNKLADLKARELELRRYL